MAMNNKIRKEIPSKMAINLNRPKAELKNEFDMG